MGNVPQGLEQQRAALERAKRHAAEGNASEMVVALFESGLLVGLAKRIGQSWPVIPREDIQDIVGETAFLLFRAVRKGIRVDSLPAWTLKVAHRLANQRCHVVRAAAPVDPSLAVRDETDAADEEEQFASALAHLRGLLPRVQGPTVQAVLTYLLDSVAAGHEDVPASAIALALGISEGSVRTALSRGRRKFLRLLVEDGTISPSSRIVAEFLPQDRDQEDSD